MVMYIFNPDNEQVATLIEAFPGGISDRDIDNPLATDLLIRVEQEGIRSRDLIWISDPELKFIRKKIGLGKKDDRYDTFTQAVLQRHYADIAALYRVLGTKGMDLANGLRTCYKLWAADIADNIRAANLDSRGVG